MRKLTKLIGMIIGLMISIQIYGQSEGVSINTDNSPPHQSAILDVSSNSKGVLIPRLTAMERLNISSPAEGLLVYQTNDIKGFYFYTGSEWKFLITDSQITDYGSGQIITSEERIKLNNLEFQTLNLIGNDLTLAPNGGTTNLSAIKPTPEIAIFEDRKPAGSNAGTFEAGTWVTRTLNYTAFNNSESIERIGNIIRLFPGTYLINANAPAYRVRRHCIRFIDVTNNPSNYILLGTSEYIFSDNLSTTNRSFILDILVVTDVTDFEVQHRCEETFETSGLGIRTNFQENIYTKIFIQKID